MSPISRQVLNIFVSSDNASGVSIQTVLSALAGKFSDAQLRFVQGICFPLPFQPNYKNVGNVRVS